MTNQSESETLTRGGPGTPMGELMRQYWFPAAMSSELEANGDPMRLMLLGEKLIAFRDTSGRVGVMDQRCPHRCASLFFGRNEEDGIRCVYHGWKYDVNGNCLDQANLPAHQDFQDKVRAKAYKTAERNGLIWVYMGNDEMPAALPEIDANLVPEEQMGINFQFRECNWLQSIEGDIDTSHLGFLHFGAVNTSDHGDASIGVALANRAPEYAVKETDYGVTYGAYRDAEDGRRDWRVAHFLFPFFSITPLGALDRSISFRANVPVDDEHTMCVILVKNDNRTAEEGVRSNAFAGGADHDYDLPHTTDWYGRWRLKARHANDFLIDREKQRTQNYTGIGGINLQDQMINESMGPIVDRTWEHLAPSDQMIATTRRRLLRAAKAYAKDGTLPPCAGQPNSYAAVRGGTFFADPDADWFEVAREIVASAPGAQRIAEGGERTIAPENPARIDADLASSRSRTGTRG